MTHIGFEEWFNKNYGIEDIAMKNALKEVAFKSWQAAKPQWQPIETAPKETPILCYDKDTGENAVVCIISSNGYNDYYPYIINEYGNHVVTDDECHSVIATHWMPLPQPPSHHES